MALLLISGAGIDMKRYRVLLVDDEVMILEGLRRLFDWEKYECEVIGEAMDGATAVHMASSLSPDLIIMDINIPVMDGLEAVEMIKAQNTDIQIILVTGYDDFRYCQKALRMNVVDYILKPIDYNEFGEVIEKAKKNSQHRLLEEIGRKDSDGKIISQMMSWLNDHIQEEITLERMAEEFHMNSKYISQMFKERTGVNYHTYLTQIRINKAKQYLKSSDMSVVEVSHLVGYGDYRTFTRKFKMMTGELPSQYRRVFRRA